MGDPAQLVEVEVDAAGDLREAPGGIVGRVRGRLLGHQRNRDEALTDLIVELAGDALALGFLGGESDPGGVVGRGGRRGFEDLGHGGDRRAPQFRSPIYA